MVQARTRAWLSTVTLVVGALLIGDAIHGVVTIGAFGPTSPAALLRVVAGIALVAVGAQLRTPAESYISSVDPEPDETGSADGDGEFEPELSPLGGEMEAQDREDGATDGDESSGH